MLILNSDEVRKALPMHEVIQAMKQAYASLSSGKANVPLRTRLPIPARDAVSIFMPAYLQTDDSEALAIKVVSIFPQNPGHGLPLIYAAVLALDPETGRTIALLEGGAITAIRTGAGSGAAIDILAREDSHVVAIFGAGAQGRTQLEAACAVRNIHTVWIFDADAHRAEALAKEMAGQGLIPQDIRVAATAREAVVDADIICAATTATSPVFMDKDIKPGTHISAIGSYTPEMQEIPAETIQRARVIVDSRSAVLAESGDLIKPIQSGLFSEAHVFAELGEIVLGDKPGRQSSEEITYFKSVGVAVQDTMAAQLALKNAHIMHLGQDLLF
jgi:ornithine cyclodeaminase